MLDINTFRKAFHIPWTAWRASPEAPQPSEPHYLVSCSSPALAQATLSSPPAHSAGSAPPPQAREVVVEVPAIAAAVSVVGLFAQQHLHFGLQEQSPRTMNDVWSFGQAVLVALS
jgi:hypothetical protein